MPAPLLYLVLAVNVVTFGLFAYDKARARGRRRRVAETTLLLWSWAGGALGGWAGMLVCRHKTAKTSFVVRMTLVTVFNAVWAVLWLCR